MLSLSLPQTNLLYSCLFYVSPFSLVKPLFPVIKKHRQIKTDTNDKLDNIIRKCFIKLSRYIIERAPVQQVIISRPTTSSGSAGQNLSEILLWLTQLVLLHTDVYQAQASRATVETSVFPMFIFSETDNWPPVLTGSLKQPTIPPVPVTIQTWCLS